MRIITGRFKGRTLRTVKDLSVRPATDRVKQTVFNMLVNRMELEDAEVLDLFAGSGALGIEALSRGARHVTFVETSRRAADFIDQNLAILGCEEETEVLEIDAMTYLRMARKPYDLVFADPPYEYELTPQIPDLVFSSGIVKRHGYLLIEHASSLHFNSTPAYVAGPEKKFGRTLVTFFRHTDSPRPDIGSDRS